MNQGQTIFSQIMNYIPKYKFDSCKENIEAAINFNHSLVGGNSLFLVFAELTYRESLSDIETCLRAMQNKLYFIGIKSKISRSTLAYANQNKDWGIYAEFAYILVELAKKLNRYDKFFKELDGTVYALDPTTIDLSLSLFPWAKLSKTKSAIKIHTLLNIQNNIPSFFSITDGSVHDVNLLDVFVTEIGAFYIIDKDYIDFERLYKLNINSAYFVTRAKENLQFKKVHTHKVDKLSGMICDQSIFLTGFYPLKDYPEKIRCIKYFDSENKRSFVFLLKNFYLAAINISNIYKLRWQIELLFKGIKQNFKIKSFYGNFISLMMLRLTF